jgi:hypothetical protein
VRIFWYGVLPDLSVNSSSFNFFFRL